MKSYNFQAFLFSEEIDLGAIAKHFGFSKKYKWGEALILADTQLKGIVNLTDDKYVFAYHFGSIVFVNFEHHEVMDVLNYFKHIGEEVVKNPVNFSMVETFRLDVREGAPMEVNFDFAVIGTLQDYSMRTLALILAKSIALKKVEFDTDILMDESEKIMDYLEKGKFKMKDKQLSKMSSKTLRVRHNSISSLMLLDAPDIAWKNEGIEEFYYHLLELFELSDRFDKIKNKTAVLLETIDVFSSLMHTKRGQMLEWIVIVLIAAEIVMGIIKALE